MLSASNIFFASAAAPRGSIYLMSGEVVGPRLHRVWSSRVNFVQIHFVGEAPECSCAACAGLDEDVSGCETYHAPEGGEED